MESPIRSLRIFLFSFLVLFGFVSCRPADPAYSAPEPVYDGSTGQARLDGPPSTMGSGTYPRITVLKDKTLLGTISTVDGPSKVLITVSSPDRGTTWTPHGEIFRCPTGNTDTDNPFVIQLPTGEILAAYRNHAMNQDGTYAHYKIDVSQSTDGGATFSYLSTLADMLPQADNHNGGNWEPFLRLAADGTLQGYYSHENGLHDQDNFLRTSRDGGKTWSWHHLVSGGPQTRDGMIGVAPMNPQNAPKSLLAVFECGNCEKTHALSLKSVTSPDDGKTWGQRRDVFIAANGAHAGAPQVADVGGVLMASFMTDEDNPEGGSWPTKSALKIVMSSDKGATWGGKVTVAGGATGGGYAPSTGGNAEWGGVMAVDSKTAIVMYEVGGKAMAQRVTVG